MDERAALEVKEKDYLVSAIVPTYNSERFMRGCLEDLENQTLADRLEIIVVDDGSEQNEERIVREFQQSYANIKFLKGSHRGIYSACNLAIKAAAGKYITSAATDDRHAPQMLEILARELDEHPDIALVYSDYYITLTDNATWASKGPTALSTDWPRDFSKDTLLLSNYVGPQPLWRRSLHDEYGYYDELFMVSGDYELALRVAQTHPFKLVREPLGLYLYRENSAERATGVLDYETAVVWTLYRNNGSKVIRRPVEKLKTTVFVVSTSDLSDLEKCLRSLNYQEDKEFKLQIIRERARACGVVGEIIDRCDTEFFIIVDQRTIFNPDAIATMQRGVEKASQEISMLSFLLRDMGSGQDIPGVRIYRTSHLKGGRYYDSIIDEAIDEGIDETSLLEQFQRNRVESIIRRELVGLRTG